MSAVEDLKEKYYFEKPEDSLGFGRPTPLRLHDYRIGDALLDLAERVDRLVARVEELEHRTGDHRAET